MCVCVFWAGSKVFAWWNSVAKKPATWTYCSVLWNAGRTRLTLNLHGVPAWGELITSWLSTSIYLFFFVCLERVFPTAVYLVRNTVSSIGNSFTYPEGMEGWVDLGSCNNVSTLGSAFLYTNNSIQYDMQCIVYTGTRSHKLDWRWTEDN